MSRCTRLWKSRWAWLAVIVMGTASAGPLQAQLWTGGAANDDWSDADNWDPAVPTNDGNAVTSFDDEDGGDSVIDSPWHVEGMVFVDADTGQYFFSGGPLTIGAGGIESNTDAIHAFDPDIVLSDSQTWVGDFRLFGAVDTGEDGHTFTIDTQADYHIIDFYEPVSGDANWIKTGEGILHFLAANTFTGNVELNEGQIWLEATDAFSTVPLLSVTGDSTIVPLGGPRTLNALVELGADLTIGADAMETELTPLREASTLTLTNGLNVVGGDRTLTVENRLTSILADTVVDLDTHRLTLNVDEAAALLIDADVTGDGGLSKSGDGVLLLTGQNDYASDTLLLGGTLIVGSDAALPAASDLVVQGASTLRADDGLRTVDSDVELQADLTVDGSDDLLLAGELSGAGTLIKAGDATLTLANDGSQAATVIDAGVLRLVEGATLANMVTVDGGMFMLNGEVGGDVTVNDGAEIRGLGLAAADLLINDGGRIRPGNSFGVLSVGGDFILSSGAEYVVEFSVAESDNHRIDVTGDASLEEGSRLTLSQLDTGFVTDGYEWLVLTADAIIEADPIIESDSLFVTYEGEVVSNGDDAFFITAHRASFESEAVGDNNRRIAAALDSTTDDLSQELGALLNQLERLPSFDAFNAALPSIGPGAYNALSQAAFRRNQHFHLNLSRQLAIGREGRHVSNDLAYAGPSPLAVASAQPFIWDDVDNDSRPRNDRQGPAPDSRATFADEHRWNVFATGYGLFDRQDAGTDRVGYRADTAGMLAGVEYYATEAFTVGLTVGYSDTDLSLRHGRGDGDIQNLRVGPFATFSDGPLFVEASATYGYHDNDINRRVAFNNFDETARGDFNAHDIAVYLGAGYQFILPDERTTITPLGAMEYTHYRQDGFQETGGGGANLNVQRAEINSLRATAGVKLTHAWITDGPRFYPNAWVGYTRELLAEDNDFTFRIENSQPFTISGGSNDRDAIRFGGGLTAMMGQNLSIYASYDGHHGSNGVSHAGSVGLGYRF